MIKIISCYFGVILHPKIRIYNVPMVPMLFGGDHFPWSRIQSRSSAAVSCHVSLVSRNPERFLHLPLSFMFLTIGKSTGQLFYRRFFSILLCLKFPCDSMRVMHFWTETPQTRYCVLLCASRQEAHSQLVPLLMM